MNQKPTNPRQAERARSLRSQETKSESLLWALLRGSQLNDLKFRRQHPIGPYFVDFACVGQQLVIEIDGGYHDAVGEADSNREAYLHAHGWRVIRFSAENVEIDVELVARAIASQLGLEFDFQRRDLQRSGMMHENTPKGPRQSVRDIMRSE